MQGREGRYVGKIYALIIPESRTRPHTAGRLYKKVDHFLEQKGLGAIVDIYIVTIENGIVDPTCEPRGQLQCAALLYPPSHFRSGRSALSRKKIEQMACTQAKQLMQMSIMYKKIIAYSRGSYRESTAQAAKLARVPLTAILNEFELSVVKRRGILWMKAGLRMREVFDIFERRMVATIDGKKEQTRIPV